MDKPTTVRLADKSDIEAVYWCCMGLKADNWLGIPESPRKVLKTITKCCSMEYGVAGVIDGPNGSILGTIGIETFEPWFSSQACLGQTWLFLHPRARRGAALADDLFAFAEWHRRDMSERLGYDIVFENTVLSLQRLPAKIRLWSKYGTQIGATFWSRGDHGIEEPEVERGPNGQLGVGLELAERHQFAGGVELDQRFDRKLPEQFDGELAEQFGDREHGEFVPDDGGERPGAAGGVPEPAVGGAADDVEPAPALQRPTRRRANARPTGGDQPDRERIKPRNPIFD